MSESLVDKYIELIEGNPDKGSNYLASMFGEMHGIRLSGKQFGIFSKLTKLYGNKRVFYALLDVYDMEKVNTDNPYPLIAYFIKKRMEAKEIIPQESLADFINRQKKEIGKRVDIVKRSLDE